MELTKKEAIAAMDAGEKVTHDLFTTDEFIYKQNGKIHDENGYNIDSEFWYYRRGREWELGWRIYYERERISSPLGN